MGDLPPEHPPILLIEHRQRLERARVLRQQRALLDRLRVRIEPMCLCELGGVGEQLLVRDRGERVLECRIRIRVRLAGSGSGSWMRTDSS